MKVSKSGTLWIFFAAVFVSVIFVNLISVGYFYRFDMTKDKRFTLSSGSLKTMESLSDTMVITAYFTEGLPAPYASYSRYVRDMLEEYRAASKDKLAFEFIDPSKEESEEDKLKKRDTKEDLFGRVIREPTSVEMELMKLGVQPVEIRVIEDDQQQTKRAYMGLVVRYQGKKEVLPVVQDFSSFEKDLTIMMRRLIREEAPVVALISDNTSHLKNLKTLLSETATVRELAQEDLKEIPAEAIALVIAGAGRNLKEEGLKAIDAFVASGKNAAFFLDRYEFDPNTFSPKASEGSQKDLDIWGLLQSYGIRVGEQLVADVQCASLTVQEQRGEMMFGIPMRYPFMPQVASMEQDSPVTYGLSAAIFPFVSPVFVDNSELVVRPLARSSEKSWLEEQPVDTDPRREWKKEDIESQGAFNLLVELKGRIKSKFDEKGSRSSKESRLLIAGTSAFMWDQFFSEENQVLSIASVDYLVSDDIMLSMRKRNFVDLPIDPELSDQARTTAKIANILGVPALLVAYGLFRWRRREMRRKKICVELI